MHTQCQHFVSVTALPSFLMPAAVERTGTWERNLCLLQIRCCLWSEDSVISRAVLPLLGIRAWWQMGATLVLFPAGFSPRLGWASLWVVCAGDNRSHLALGSHGSHSFWPSMPMTISDSSLPPKASAGSEASQQVGIPSLCRAGSPGHHRREALPSLLLPPHLLHFSLKTFWVQPPKRLLLLWGISRHIPWALPAPHPPGWFHWARTPLFQTEKEKQEHVGLAWLSSGYDSEFPMQGVGTGSIPGQGRCMVQPKKKKSMWARLFLLSFPLSYPPGPEELGWFPEEKKLNIVLAGVAPTAPLSPPRDPKPCHSVLPSGTRAIFFALWSEYYAFALTGLIFHIGATDLFGTRTY